MKSDFEMPPFLQDESTREYMSRHTATDSPVDSVTRGDDEDDSDGEDYTLPGQKRHPQPSQPSVTFNSIYGNRKIKTTWTPDAVIVLIILLVIVIVLAFTSLSS